MASDHRQQVRQVFMEVADLPEAERQAALAKACGGDAALRAEVEALLRADQQAGGFMVTPGGFAPDARAAATGDATSMAAALPEGPGSRIGPYRILQLIGEGGFGSVFMAEQEAPVARRVALKIIKLGMDTRQVVARFEQERQALAMMDHPNIARVLDAGATETGRPFFVMELVKGEPIVEYCDKNNLSIQDRLKLFTQVCSAVQHAHTKGIIHRDIKPSNILVSTLDGRPHTKVIDFGIAKATAGRLTEKTVFTEHHQLIGTPEYMSPEQAEGTLDIDTRTDVYSLGVLLYELLTGTTPFTSKELRSAAYGEIQRIIREVEPPKPSTRLSNNTTTIASIAAHRRTEPARLGKIIRGELDWIVMKALDKDRQRRYGTAIGLALDVRRHLAGEAVGAAPPSAAYRFTKFIRRNRVVVSAAGAVGTALLMGVVAFAWQAKVARDQRDLAVAAQQAEAEERGRAEAARVEALAQQAEARKQEAEARKQAAEAKKQAAIAEAVASFQTGMFAAVDPMNLPRDPLTNQTLKDRLTVVQAIEAAVKELDKGSLKDQPLVEAEVRRTIGWTLYGLARYDEAERNLRASLAILRASLPAAHPDLAVCLGDLAALLYTQNNIAEAESMLRESLQIRRAVCPAGPEVAVGLTDLAKVLRGQNKLAEAEPLLREALELHRRALPDGRSGFAISLGALASLLREQNRLAEAEPVCREALEAARGAFPSGHPNIAAALNTLARLLHAQSKLAEAEPLYRDALEILRQAFPAGHPDIAAGLNNLATLLQARNKSAEAGRMHREALAIFREVLPPGHRDIAGGLNNLAAFLLEQNRPDEAGPLVREAVKIARTALPAEHPNIAAALGTLARFLQTQGEPGEAEQVYREALGICRKAYPAAHPDTVAALNGLATCLYDQRNLRDAEPLYREALEMARRAFSPGRPEIATALNNLAKLLQAQEKSADAEPLLREAMEIRRAALPEGHRDIANSLGNLGSVLRDQKDQSKLAEAEPLCREALEITRKAFPAGHLNIAVALNDLARVLQARNSPAEAEPLYREALEIRRRAPKPGDQGIAQSLSNLARAQQMLGKVAEARAGWDEAIALLRRGKESPLMARVLWRSGEARLENGDAAAALPELEEAVAMAERLLPRTGSGPADSKDLDEFRPTLERCRAVVKEQAQPEGNGGG